MTTDALTPHARPRGSGASTKTVGERLLAPHSLWHCRPLCSSRCPPSPGWTRPLAGRPQRPLGQISSERTCPPAAGTCSGSRRSGTERCWSGIPDTAVAMPGARAQGRVRPWSSGCCSGAMPWQARRIPAVGGRWRGCWRTIRPSWTWCGSNSVSRMMSSPGGPPWAVSRRWRPWSDTRVRLTLPCRYAAPWQGRSRCSTEVWTEPSPCGLCWHRTMIASNWSTCKTRGLGRPHSGTTSTRHNGRRRGEPGLHWQLPSRRFRHGPSPVMIDPARRTGRHSRSSSTPPSCSAWSPRVNRWNNGRAAISRGTPVWTTPPH